MLFCWYIGPKLCLAVQSGLKKTGAASNDQPSATRALLSPFTSRSQRHADADAARAVAAVEAEKRAAQAAAEQPTGEVQKAGARPKKAKAPAKQTSSSAGRKQASAGKASVKGRQAVERSDAGQPPADGTAAAQSDSPKAAGKSSAAGRYPSGEENRVSHADGSQTLPIAADSRAGAQPAQVVACGDRPSSAAVQHTAGAAADSWRHVPLVSVASDKEGTGTIIDRTCSWKITY